MKPNIVKPRDVAVTLLDTFVKHRGEHNAITSHELFTQIWLREPKEDLGDIYRWQTIKTALHYLRFNTKCFIVSRRNKNGLWEYFVPTNMMQAEPYMKRNEVHAKMLKEANKRCRQSVNEKWYLEAWKIPEVRKIK